jgi:hypothetical protein
MEARSQFSAPYDVQGCHWSVQEAEPDPVVHQELEVSVLLVVVGFVVLLDLFQVVTDLPKELITLRQLLSHRRHAHHARLVRADGGGGGVTAKNNDDW